MKVIAFPKGGIAYTECFYRAVEAEGTAVVEGEFGGRWLLRNVERGDVVHLHWPSFSHAHAGPNAIQFVWFFRFVWLLAAIRALGGRVMWTAHNLLPHDRSKNRWMDIAGRQVVIALAEAIFVHGAETAGMLGTRFPRSKTKLRLIPHGNWIEYYPNQTNRCAARRRLGIADATYVYLFIGLCKPYKNIDGLLRAFREVNGDSALLVAGAFPDPAYRGEIERLAKDDPRVKLCPEFIPVEEIQVYLQACNVVVAPYREILTSGIGMVAAGFGRPVLSIDRGYLRDLVDDETGILFEPNDPASLIRAMRDVRGRSYSAERIMERARRHTFADAARVFTEVIRRVAR